MTEAEEKLIEITELLYGQGTISGEYRDLVLRTVGEVEHQVKLEARIEMLEELSLFVPHQALMGKKIIDRRCSDGCCDKWYKEINRLLDEAEGK